MAHSMRWAVATNCFLALFFSFTLRLDFSIAIVCMVKSSNGSSADASNSTNHTAAYSQMNDDGRCELLRSGSAVTGQGGEFEWDKKTQAELLAAFSYGYITTQILGGWLARRYGTRRVLGLSMVVTILATLLTPVCARTHVYLLFAIRLMTGMSQGVSLPAVFNLAGRWAPPLEISRFVTVCDSGFPLGYIVSFGLSGFLCAYGFDNGWGSIFFIFGIGAALLMVSWFYFVHDTPAEHPRISSNERKFIESKLGRMDREKECKYPTPWMAILTSPPFWANVFAYWADDWVNYTLQLGLIVYMKEALYYDITQGTQQEWRNVFYVCGAMSLFGAVAFGVLTRGEIQKWAKVPETDQEVTVEMVSTNDTNVTLGQSMKD